MSLTITLPWKHLASSNTRNTRRGGRGHGWAYKRARDAIHLHALDQVRGERPAIPEASCRMTLLFYPPDKRRRDVPNLIKVILDSLQGVVYTDDYQVRIASFERMPPDRDDPRVEITVEAV